MSTELDVLGRDERAILDAVPSDGSTIGNRALRGRLKWSSQRYFTARNHLVDAGLLVRGRGYGGSVRLATTEAPSERTVSVIVPPGNDPVVTIEASIKNELALYEPMRSVIIGDWARDRQSVPLAVEITALQGRRATGGLWSRPDIVSVEVRTFVYVPGKHIDVVTFEVKASNAINVQAVYEALAHRRSATRSYVLLHVPSGRAEDLWQAVDDVAEVARQHGIGVLAAGDPGDYLTWDEVVEAQRVEPDPERLDSFIRVQLSAETRDLISKRLR